MIKNKRGFVFIIVMVISVLMILIAVSSSNMLLQDVHMIKHLKYSMQAQYLSEAGMNAALAILADNFTAKTNPSNFPLTNFGGGTYDVTVKQSGTKVLLSSEGKFRGVSRTATCEVRDNTPTSLYYIMSSGSLMYLGATYTGGLLWQINGNMHAMGNMIFYVAGGTRILIRPCGSPCCDGSISSTSRIYIYESPPTSYVSYSGAKTEYAPGVTFPSFDYNYYHTVAAASGNLYTTNMTFKDQTLRPGNGLIFVYGTARFSGTCHLYGGIVANRIIISGKLYQHKSGKNRNVIIARGASGTDADIDVYATSELNVEEALVYSERDFKRTYDWSTLVITGAVMAKRYMLINRWITGVRYNHRVVMPDGLLASDGQVKPLRIVSWNR